MSYNIKDLNVASLDYTEIVESLITFLEKQPNLTDIDFRSPSSTANMLINVLATATAYNGVYTYFGFNESFKMSAQNLESFSALASNEGILLSFGESALSNITLSATQNIPAYTAFSAKTTDNSNILFFNTKQITAGTGNYNLYSGSQTSTFTDYNVEGQYIIVPLTVDPRTITFKTTDVITLTEINYTRIDRGEEATTSGNYFTVINAPNGYMVTNNIANSTAIDLNKKVEVKAVISNGYIGNAATITPLSTTTFVSQTTPSGGFDSISIEQARSKILINGNGRKRWTTLNDLKYAIMSSHISGTDEEENITVSNGPVPGTVKVYVNNLDSTLESTLIAYLQNIGPAGISISYSL
jgi:hypothetical protein